VQAGTCFRSEQSGCSADAVAHPIRVNQRARVQAEHDCVQPLDLLLIESLAAHAESEPLIKPARRAATRSPTRYSLSFTASDCPDLVASDPLTRRAQARSGRHNHEVGTIGGSLSLREGGRPAGRESQPAARSIRK
jgi:S-methylmethionine-dependent homocysteine/selenocysteine methylase